MRRGPRIWEHFNFYVGPYREIPQGLLGSSVRAGEAVVGLRELVHVPRATVVSSGLSQGR